MMTLTFSLSTVTVVLLSISLIENYSVVAPGKKTLNFMLSVISVF